VSAEDTKIALDSERLLADLRSAQVSGEECCGIVFPLPFQLSDPGAVVETFVYELGVQGYLTVPSGFTVLVFALREDGDVLVVVEHANNGYQRGRIAGHTLESKESGMLEASTPESVVALADALVDAANRLLPAAELLRDAYAPSDVEGCGV
jgi:hypothetical protein